MEFTISQKELKRREKAFAALLISFLIGIFIFSFLFKLSVPSAWIIFISIILFFLYIITFKHLNSLSQMKIVISDQKIVREKGVKSEEYSILEINSIKIKRRTSGTIREIYISFRNRKYLYINAFEERFELLKDALLSKINDKTPVKEFREPIDFDHALFYPTLGLLISFFSVFFFKQILRADYSSFMVILLIFSVYNFSLGIYFLLKKPIAIGAGKDQAVTDYIFGTIMIIASILMAIIGLRFGLK